MLIYLHVIRLYWNWHTCIPYALGHPRNIGDCAWYKSREDGSESSLKKVNRRRVVHKLNNISTVGAAQLIFIHRRVVHKQIIYINRRSGPIDIYTSEGCPLIK